MYEMEEIFGGGWKQKNSEGIYVSRQRGINCNRADQKLSTRAQKMVLYT